MLIFSVHLSASTIMVPSEQATIQLGIANAVDGDTILVVANTYTGVGNKNIDFFGKNVYVVSDNPSENVIIDLEQDGRAFYLHLLEETATIDGFTVINGEVSVYGGALYLESASLTIVNSTFETNHATSGGSALYIGTNGNIELNNCVFNQSSGYTVRGGHIFVNGGTLLINNSSFERGFVSSGGYGGSLYIGSSGNVEIHNSAFRENDASPLGNSGYGGAIYILNSDSLVIKNTTFTNNISSSSGGAIFINNTASSITNSVFKNNSGFGNSVYLSASEVLLENVLAYGGTNPLFFASVEGLYNINHSTIVNNNIDCVEISSTGGISTFRNSILKWLINGPSPVIENCINGDDTQFVNVENRDYRLAFHSSAIGQASITELMLDINGNPRPDPIGSNPDIGCYESSLGEALSDESLIYVSNSGDDIQGTGDIDNPLATVSYAASAGNSTDTVMVMPGVYYEDISYSNTGSVCSVEGPELTVLDAGEEINLTSSTLKHLNGFTLTTNNVKCIDVSFPDNDTLKLENIVTSTEIFVSGETQAMLIDVFSTSNFTSTTPERNTTNLRDFTFTMHNVTLENVLIISPILTTSDIITYHFDLTNVSMSDFRHSPGGDSGMRCLGNIRYSSINGDIYLVQSQVHFSNSIFSNGELSGNSTVGHPSFTNCSFFNYEVFDGLYHSYNNSIFWPSIVIHGNPINNEMNYCINAPIVGVGNIVGDPLFRDAENNDFSLMPGSPCIDMGDPLLELDGDGTRKDIGAMYFNQNGAYEANILNIVDVESDQGGRLRLSWTKSPNDTIYGNVVDYGIWRVLNNGNTDAIGQIPATQSENYQYVVQTLSDSTSTNSGWEKFYITAHTDRPWVFYASSIDSGYSVDNIAPYAPESLISNFTGELVQLSWVVEGNNDLYYYEVFKNGEPYVTTETPIFSDNILLGTNAIYTIRGTDTHENVGSFSVPFEVANGVLGDITWDESINVLDATQLIYMILNPAEDFTINQLWAGDMNDDGVVDITDLPLIVDIIMEGALSSLAYQEGEPYLYFEGKTLYLSSIEPVAGIQLEFTSAVDIENLSGLSMLSNNDVIAIYTLSDEVLVGQHIPILELAQDETIESVIISNHLGEQMIPTVGINPGVLVPLKYAVHQNYPNPFNPTTTIKIDLDEASHLSVKVYDLMGVEVCTLINDDITAGYHSINWNGTDTIGKDVSSGIYFVRVTTESNNSSIKVTLLR